MTQNVTIEAEGLTVDVNGRSPSAPVDLVARPGELVALVGPSGAGKTTLLHGLGLLLVPRSGRVVINGQDAGSWSSRRRRRFWADSAAFILQDAGVMDDESVLFNVVVTRARWGRGAGGDRGRAADALSRTGLRGREQESAAHLSGGEKQRLALARAIYSGAGVIYADEPTASLDAANRRMVAELLHERAEAGATVLVATHDEELARSADHRVQISAADLAAAAGPSMAR